MKLSAVGHALNRLHLTAFSFQPKHQTRQNRAPVNQHRARTTLAQLAAVFRAGEIQIFTQHFEQRLVRRKSYFGVFAVQTETYLSLAVHRELLLWAASFF